MGDDSQEMGGRKPTLRLSFKPCLGVRVRRLTTMGVMESDWFLWKPASLKDSPGNGQTDWSRTDR